MATLDKKKQNTEEEAIPKKENASQTAENAPQGDRSNEEQLMRRQSAPRPTAESEARKLYQMQQAKAMMGQGRRLTSRSTDTRKVKLTLSAKSLTMSSGTSRGIGSR